MEKPDQHDEKKENPNLKEANGDFERDQRGRQQAGLRHRVESCPAQSHHNHENSHSGKKKSEPAQGEKISEYQIKGFLQSEEDDQDGDRFAIPVKIEVGVWVIDENDESDGGRNGYNRVQHEKSELAMAAASHQHEAK